MRSVSKRRGDSSEFWGEGAILIKGLLMSNRDFGDTENLVTRSEKL